MLSLDGSYGEGGGQVLRTALSLAALTGVAVRIEGIRAKRSKPGLRPQHLTAVQAVARVSQGEVTGARLGSQALTFKPRTPQGGHYCFDVAETTGSAGAVTLVAQALLPPLLKAESPATVILKGGTHVPWSPPAHYLSHVFLPALAAMGAEVEMTLERWGWYPRGGGEVRLSIGEARRLTGLECAPPRQVQHSGSGPRRPTCRSTWPGGRRPGLRPAWVRRCRWKLSPPPARTGAAWSWSGGPGRVSAALGARGKPAEQVADEAAEAYLAFRASGGACDRHLADQMLIYLALAEGPSRFTTEAVTSHLLTNVWVIEQFLGPTFQIQGALGEPGEIFCKGR